MRRLNETPQHIYYPEGAAPFGELGVLRGQHASNPIGRVMMAGAAGLVLQRAWSESDWLSTAMHNPLAGPHARRHARSAVSGSAANMARAAVRSFYAPTRSATWYAMDPRSERNPIGISHIAQDVSGGRLQQIYKRIAAPHKEYAKVSDVNVLPGHQKKGYGAALLDAALRTVRDPEQVPTTYTPTHNTELIAKLDDLGFKVTGSHPRTDLVEGLTIEEARLAAPSVAHVQGALHEMYPWLDNAQVLH